MRTNKCAREIEISAGTIAGTRYLDVSESAAKSAYAHGVVIPALAPVCILTIV